MHSESEQLLKSAQNGDRRALESLLAAHRSIVFRYGLRYCKTTEDAEDAVQQTLWAATQSIAKFRRAASIATWLFTIVRNKCHRMNRRPTGDDLADWLPNIADEADSIEQKITAQQIEALLALALSKLNSNDREVLILRDVEGLTAPEAAAILSIGVAALKSRLHRARAELREQVRVLGLAPSIGNVRH